jgi:hypothetical protein
MLLRVTLKDARVITSIGTLFIRIKFQHTSNDSWEKTNLVKVESKCSIVGRHSFKMTTNKKKKAKHVREITLAIPEIVCKCEEHDGEITPNIDDRQLIGYKLSVPIEVKHNLGFTGKATWHFNNHDICEHKVVDVNSPSWDAKMK